MSEKEIMSEEAFNELIDNLEIIEKLTPYGRKAIKYWINKLQKENEEKDKQIDLMAETIRKISIVLANYKGSYDKETINFTSNIKCIKQYFETKAKEKGE